jgi:eukaryotic-like serine/threonine-protein kinase
VQLAEGLAAAHDHGVVHRDLKPGNLRVTSDGRLKILDFGLAKLWRPVTASAATESLSETQAMAGTVPYMAPEQLLGGAIDARTDLHAAGSVFYEMATGQRPFAEVEHAQLIAAILHRPPRPPTALNPHVSPELERIIGKCLEKEPGDRYQSAKELAVDLRRLGRDKESGHLVVETPAGPWLGHPVRHGSTTVDSLAILPLVNVTRDLDKEYLSDGITESIINALSQLSQLRVMARSTVFRYKGREIDPRTVGHELHVKAVLVGRIDQRMNELIISAELVDVADGSQLWGQQYQYTLSDIFTMQEAIANEISDKLRLKLSRQEKKRLTKRYTENPEAYQLYLKGRYHWNRRTEDDLKKAAEYFRQATEKDPHYALGYAGLADASISLGAYSFDDPKEAFLRAKAAALKTLEIDNTLAEAHTSLAAVIAILDWDWSGAEREFKRAIQLNPNYATAHHWYAEYMAQVSGRYNEAFAEIRRAQELDPLALIINTDIGEIFYFARQYDRAVEQWQETLELDADFAPVHRLLGYAYEQQSRFEEAIVEFEKAISLSPTSTDYLAGLGHAYAVSGQVPKAKKVLNKLHRLARQRYVPSYDIAVIYVGLGEHDLAFNWLENAYVERPWQLLFLKVDPRLDPLRSDPRFQDLLRRMNFPQ